MQQQKCYQKKQKGSKFTPIPASLHWLPVSFRVNFKTLMLVYRRLNDLAPSYLKELLTSYHTGRELLYLCCNILELPSSNGPISPPLSTISKLKLNPTFSLQPFLVQSFFTSPGIFPWSLCRSVCGHVYILLLCFCNCCSHCHSLVDI